MNIVAYYAYLGGWVGAVLAAVPGLMDYLAIKEKIPRRIATYHMVINLIIVVLMAINIALRIYAPGWEALAYLISGTAILALLVSGWLGGELVHVYGVSVDPERGAGRLGAQIAGDVAPPRAGDACRNRLRTLCKAGRPPCRGGRVSSSPKRYAR